MIWHPSIQSSYPNSIDGWYNQSCYSNAYWNDCKNKCCNSHACLWWWRRGYLGLALEQAHCILYHLIHPTNRDYSEIIAKNEEIWHWTTLSILRYPKYPFRLLLTLHSLDGVAMITAIISPNQAITIFLNQSMLLPFLFCGRGWYNSIPLVDSCCW